MAQAKAKSSAKRSGGSQKPRPRSRGSSNRKAGAPKGASTRKPSSNAQVGKAASQAVSAVGNATSTVGHAADKAKIPLVAGGAALAGVAGGMVLGARQARRHKGIGKVIPRRPQVKVSSSDLAGAAKDVGSFGAQLGHLATELQRSREAANGGGHRSPLEVVLEGLTARRSRA